jgi:DNA-binding transcriptional MocR family regulator
LNSMSPASVETLLTDLHGSLNDPLLDSMNFLNEVTGRYPDAISFAPGRPHEEHFDVATIADYLGAYTDHLRRDRGLDPAAVSRTLFQYGRTNGIIHELIAATLHNDEDLRVAPEALVVTVGCQEGMLLALRALIRDSGDVLLVSSPCYVGIAGAARILDVPMELVPEGPDGPDPAAVRAACARVRASGRRPRALYVVPDFANPSGTNMSLTGRQHLLAAAAEQDLLILEDNPYGFFSRTGTTRPTLKRLDTGQRVIYLGSFAKTCLPGARVGYVVADQRVRAPDGGVRLLADELSKIKSMTTVNTPSITQALVGGMLLRYGCRLRQANADRIALYRAKLETLLAALDRHFPEPGRARLGIDWNRPDGGFFLVLTVPFTADDRALVRCAEQYQVLWTPMSYFYLDGGGANQLRLSCSYLPVSQIDEGIRRLRRFVTDHLDGAATARG